MPFAPSSGVRVGERDPDATFEQGKARACAPGGDDLDAGAAGVAWILLAGGAGWLGTGTDLVQLSVAAANTPSVNAPRFLFGIFVDDHMLPIN